MPVVSSILWKPLRDSHYVLTSIQPGQGGLRQIFVLQSVLDRVRRLARQRSGAHPVGLLLGARFDCPVTGTRYVLIESLEEIGEAAQDASSMTAALVDRVKHHRGSSPIECVGWYASSGAPEPQVSSAHAAVHRSLFDEPWVSALMVADGGNVGAFFLQDTRASRWFQAPFYEVGNADRKDGAAKPTCIAWPGYLTSETVVPLTSLKLAEVARPRATSAPKPATSRRAAGLGDAIRRVYRVSSRLFVNVFKFAVKVFEFTGVAARRIGALLKGPAARRAAARARSAVDRAKARAVQAEQKEQARAAHAERLRVAAAARIEREQAAREQAAREQAARERTERERAERERVERQRARDNAQRQAPEPARAVVVQPGSPTPPPKQARVAEQQAASPKQAPPSDANDGEDTTVSDQPYRFLALARREGFQVSANMERPGAKKGVETVWLLNEPEHGIQVTLVTSDVAVLEANLHYNIRPKDAALWNATKPEHRDFDSRVIYVREPCAVGLRAKCRRLRASGALERDWKVSPRIYPPDAATR